MNKTDLQRWWNENVDWTKYKQAAIRWIKKNEKLVEVGVVASLSIASYIYLRRFYRMGVCRFVLHVHEYHLIIVFSFQELQLLSM